MPRRPLSPAFTVLEILIVLAVFGLLATLAVLSLNSARASVRDSQRVSDVSVIRTALSQYWFEHATYPVSTGVSLGAPGTGTDVFTSTGFAATADAKAPFHLNRVPVGPKANEYYRYHGGPTGYSIRFQTESDTSFGKANVYFAHTTVVDGADDEK